MANTIILPFSELQAELNDEAMIDPNAVIDITENGLYNVAKYGYANVNVEGGGETWETVFEGSVTTTENTDYAQGEIDANITADTIKVTFNETEYTCEKKADGPFTIYGDMSYTEYPFAIVLGMGTWYLSTPEAGTYTLKIEEPQSDGESDFSTAEVTIIDEEGFGVYAPFVLDASEYPENGGILPDDATPTDGIYPRFQGDSFTGPVRVALYKGVAYLTVGEYANISEVSGNATNIGGLIAKITGDCTITISDTPSA